MNERMIVNSTLLTIAKINILVVIAINTLFVIPNWEAMTSVAGATIDEETELMAVNADTNAHLRQKTNYNLERIEKEY
jgi:hypothetical protein